MTPEIFQRISKAIDDGYYDRIINGEAGSSQLNRTISECRKQNTLTKEEAKELTLKLADRVRNKMPI